MHLQARASRLSFRDIVKRLAATEESQPTFISRNVTCVPCLAHYSAARAEWLSTRQCISLPAKTLIAAANCHCAA